MGIDKDKVSVLLFYVAGEHGHCQRKRYADLNSPATIKEGEEHGNTGRHSARHSQAPDGNWESVAQLQGLALTAT